MIRKAEAAEIAAHAAPERPAIAKINAVEVEHREKRRIRARLPRETAVARAVKSGDVPKEGFERFPGFLEVLMVAINGQDRPVCEAVAKALGEPLMREESEEIFALIDAAARGEDSRLFNSLLGRVLRHLVRSVPNGSLERADASDFVRDATPFRVRVFTAFVDALLGLIEKGTFAPFLYHVDPENRASIIAYLSSHSDARVRERTFTILGDKNAANSLREEISRIMREWGRRRNRSAADESWVRLLQTTKASQQSSKLLAVPDWLLSYLEGTSDLRERLPLIESVITVWDGQASTLSDGLVRLVKRDPLLIADPRSGELLKLLVKRARLTEELWQLVQLPEFFARADFASLFETLIARPRSYSNVPTGTFIEQVLLAPEFARRSDREALLRAAIDAGYVEEVQVFSLAKASAWSDSLEVLKRFTREVVESDRRTDWHRKLVDALMLPHWQRHPVLRRACGDQAPTLHCLEMLYAKPGFDWARYAWNPVCSRHLKR